MWADHFDLQGIQYAFFSAANAAALQQARRDAIVAQHAQAHAEQEESHPQDEDASEKETTSTAPPESLDTSDDRDEGDDEEFSSDLDSDSDSDDAHDRFAFLAEEESEDAKDPRARVLSVLELEDLFIKAAPDLSSMFSSSPLCVPACIDVPYQTSPTRQASSPANSSLVSSVIRTSVNRVRSTLCLARRK